jgi:hypothetical protein
MPEGGSLLSFIPRSALRIRHLKGASAMRVWLRLGGLAVLLAALPALAAGDAAADDAEQNARRLEKLRAADPARYERLRRDLWAFYELPPERRERMRLLYRALQEQDSLTQKHLWAALERYAAWLDALPEEERRQVEAAPDRAERLNTVRRLREEQALRRLPQRLRELPPDRRAAEAKRFRDEELVLRRRFLPGEGPAQPSGRPARLGQFPKEVVAFVEEQLRPMLNSDEKRLLEVADGRWPLLAQTIAELSERHPVLPPLPSGAIVRWQQLPPEWQKQLGFKMKGPAAESLRRLEGRWPDYALHAEMMRRDHKGPPLPPLPPLGASKSLELPQAARLFVENDLWRALDEREKDAARKTEGRWPEYPKLLHELARKHNLVIPGMSLPGPRELWESARTELPEVPDRTLIDFAQLDLRPEERAAFGMHPADPAARDRLRQAYFDRNPHELNRLRRIDRQHAQMLWK